MVKRFIVYAWKTLKYSQQWNCTIHRKLLAVVTAVELFKYYLMGRYFTVVTDYASLTWFRNFKEPWGVVAWWITWLETFDFKLMHRPGKHHNRACARGSVIMLCFQTLQASHLS